MKQSMDKHWKRMIVESVRFAVWGAGQGLCPVAGEPADSPEEFLLRFSQGIDDGGDLDWDDLPAKVERLLTGSQQL